MTFKILLEIPLGIFLQILFSWNACFQIEFGNCLEFPRILGIFLELPWQSLLSFFFLEIPPLPEFPVFSKICFPGMFLVMLRRISLDISPAISQFLEMPSEIFLEKTPGIIWRLFRFLQKCLLIFFFNFLANFS